MTTPDHPPDFSSGYLSRVSVRIDRANARHFGSPYEQHRSLWKLFSSRSSRDFLFRETLVHSGKLLHRQFLVVSAERPQPVPGFAIETKPYAPQLQAGDRVAFSLRACLTAALPVARPANPSGKLSGRGALRDPIQVALADATSPQEKGRIRAAWLFGHGGGDDIAPHPPLLATRWLAPRLARHGFELQAQSTRVMAYEPAQLQGWKTKKEPGNSGTIDRGQSVERRREEERIFFSVADIEARAIVQDADLAAKALLSGVGRGKALGYGLLLVKRDRGAAAISDEEDVDN